MIKKENIKELASPRNQVFFIIYVTSIRKVEDCELSLDGARGVKVKYLLHKRVGAKRLQLRFSSIDVGG